MIKLYHKNPREITRGQFEDLKNWLEELGDLSGLVHDLNSNEIVGGNQRSRIFDINQCEIVITEQLDEPDEQGTIAHGFVIWKGKKYGYRQVRWTEKQCEQANIVSNKAGGSDDLDILANEFEVDDLLDWGFSEEELGLEERLNQIDEELLLDQSVQLKPKMEFILVVCDSIYEFEQLRSLLGLGLVRRGGYRAGSPFDQTGPERILPANRLMEIISHVDSDAE